MEEYKSESLKEETKQRGLNSLPSQVRRLYKNKSCDIQWYVRLSHIEFYVPKAKHLHFELKVRICVHSRCFSSYFLDAFHRLVV